MRIALGAVIAHVRSCSIVCAFLLGAAAATGQPSDGGLPRRPWLGVALAPHDRGVLVTSVVDGSSAAASDIRGGDVIRSVDGMAVREPAR